MNKRQKTIFSRLKAAGYLSIVEQAKAMHVAEMTVRRDLQMFEDMGLAIRIHGGAIPKSELALSIDSIMKPARSSQIRIAKAAMRQIVPGSIIMLNTGTTVLQVAREIAASGISMTVITNSLPVAIALYKSETQVLMTGGALRRHALDLAGPLTVKNLDEYHVDTIISGCDGADSRDGFFTNDMDLAELEKKIVSIARRVIIVAEHGKFSKRSLAKFANIEDADMVITDSKLSSVDTRNFEKAGVILITN
jgi:DeoR/GlpR family transcriptional regulator of sugar metabolism